MSKNQLSFFVGTTYHGRWYYSTRVIKITNKGYKFTILKPMRFERVSAIHAEFHSQHNRPF